MWRAARLRTKETLWKVALSYPDELRALKGCDVLITGVRAIKTNSPFLPVLSREARDEVRLALAELPERQRNCVLLRHSGYSYAEIAATVGVAVGSVGVLLARGERAFREIYEEQRR